MIMANLPTSESWSLHPQLARDTIPIGDLALSRLLVVNDANWPWLLLVPRRPICLPNEDRHPLDSQPTVAPPRLVLR